MHRLGLIRTTCLGLSAQARVLGQVFFCLLRMQKIVRPVVHPYFLKKISKRYIIYFSLDFDHYSYQKIMADSFFYLKSIFNIFFTPNIQNSLINLYMALNNSKLKTFQAWIAISSKVKGKQHLEISSLHQMEPINTKINLFMAEIGVN